MNDSLGDRMKAYEDTHRIKLTHRAPKVIRLDGKAFHTFTKNLPPFSLQIVDAMNTAATKLMDEIGGSARMAYLQSDECSIVLNDSLHLYSQAWFDNNVQKIVSVASSIFTVTFNKVFNDVTVNAEPGYFDARVIQLPDINELTNYLVWRQADAVRNSIQSCAQARYSHSELHGWSCQQLIERMKTEKGFDWNTANPWIKQGSVVYDETVTSPLFKEDRKFVSDRYFPRKEQEDSGESTTTNVIITA